MTNESQPERQDDSGASFVDELDEDITESFVPHPLTLPNSLERQ